MKRGPVRDGKVHVQPTMCATCIFRPGNPMRLAPGRVAGMVADARRDWSVIVCHDTYDTKRLVCAGYADLRPTPDCLQVADRLGLIERGQP